MAGDTASDPLPGQRDDARNKHTTSGKMLAKAQQHGGHQGALYGSVVKAAPLTEFWSSKQLHTANCGGAPANKHLHNGSQSTKRSATL